MSSFAVDKSWQHDSVQLQHPDSSENNPLIFCDIAESMVLHEDDEDQEELQFSLLISDLLSEAEDKMQNDIKRLEDQHHSQ